MFKEMKNKIDYFKKEEYSTRITPYHPKASNCSMIFSFVIDLSCNIESSPTQQFTVFYSFIMYILRSVFFFLMYRECDVCTYTYTNIYQLMCKIAKEYLNGNNGNSFSR